jgi:hypothetical protein
MSSAYLHESMERPMGQNIRVFHKALIEAVERLIRPSNWANLRSTP